MTRDRMWLLYLLTWLLAAIGIAAIASIVLS